MAVQQVDRFGLKQYFGELIIVARARIRHWGDLLLLQADARVTSKAFRSEPLAAYVDIISS